MSPKEPSTIERPHEPELETGSPGGAAMRLESIEIEHFRAIAHASIVFPDGLIGLVGANGTGKSSVLAAIVYALYGSDALPYKKASLVGPGGDLAVRFTFTLGGLRYELERTLRAKDLATAATLRADGEDRARGAEAVSTEIRRLLGGHSELLVSRFVGQKQLNALSSLEAAPRKRLILRLLGVESAESAVVALRERTGEFDRAIKARRAALPDLESIRLEHASASSGLATAEHSVSEAQQTLAEAERLEAESDRARRDGESVATASAGIATAIEVAGATLSDLAEQHERLIERIGSLGDPAGSIATLDERIAAIEHDREELERLAGGALARRSLPDLQARIATLGGEIATLVASESSAERLVEAGTRAEEELARIEREIADATAERERADGALSDLRARLSIARETRTRIEERIAALTKETGGICEGCGRPYEDEASARAHLDTELARATSAEERITAEGIATREASVRAAERLGELEGRREVLRTTRDTGIHASADLRLARADLATRREEEAAARRDLASAEASSYDAERHAALESAALALPSLLGERSTLAIALAELTRLREDDERIATRHAEALARRETLEAEAAAAGIDAPALEALRATHRDATERLAVARETLARTEGERALLAEREGRLAADLARHGALLAEIESLLAERGRTELVRELMDRFKVELIGKIRPALARKASTLLRDLSDGRYGRLELDEEYEVSIGTAGALRPIRECSGGEEDLANLCLRLAISQLINESRGIGATFIVLDEVLGSQDPDRQERIMGLLPRLAGHFGQILMVAHIPSVQDRFPAVIETRFDPASETSTIEYPLGAINPTTTEAKEAA